MYVILYIDEERIFFIIKFIFSSLILGFLCLHPYHITCTIKYLLATEVALLYNFILTFLFFRPYLLTTPF